MKYTIFFHNSLYELKEEIDNATRDEVDAWDWQSFEYTMKQWPIAIQHVPLDASYACIMDRSFKVVREWIRND